VRGEGIGLIVVVVVVSPCEMLIVGELSPATEKLVKHLAGGR
jgi:hypothetical protein